MAIDGRGTMMPAFLASTDLGGASAGLDYAKKLAAQQPLYQANNTAAESLVIAGQAAIGTDVVTEFVNTSKKNAPIAVLPISPVYAPTTYDYVPTRAPHPLAGQLLVAWLSEPPGQAALAAVGSSFPGDCAIDNSPLTQVLCTNNVKWVTLTTLDEYGQLADYQTQIQQAFGTYAGS